MTTFASWISRLYTDQFTGRVTLHFVQGVPKKVEYPGEQIPLQSSPAPPLSPPDRKSD